MKRYLRTLIILVFLTVCTVVFAPSAAAMGESMNLTIKTVIDNADAYPTQVASLTAMYSAERIYKMTSSESTYKPSYTSSKVFDIKNNQSTVLTFDAYSKANCDTFWFTANQYTDKHLSLASVEFTADSNLKSYTYSPSGTLPNTYAIQPLNWVEVINSAKPTSITLHFKYNPEIGTAAPDPDPAPSYAKTIDYLGDGVTNPDTTANGVNDYRLNLDLTTQAATEDNKADVIFVLDVSGSMGDKLSSGQTKIALLRSTMTDAINSLTTNPNNRVSIIKFSDSSQVLISGSSDKTALLNAVSGLTASGCTNYYASLSDAIGQVNSMTSSDSINRDKVVIFLTDGEPNRANPAVSATSTITYIGQSYAYDVAKKFSNVDKFYSIFIGDNSGSASNLQTVTQLVPVSQEKFMVQASNAQQLKDTFTRFLSKMSNSLYNVSITDALSEYVAYIGGMKATMTSGSGSPVTLTAGVDYSVTTDIGGITVKFLNTLAADTRYALSFNVRSSDKALVDYAASKSYPAIGDPNTDYPGNTTSSGKAGFYSNASASLKYSFGASGTAEKAYSKPVVQVVELPPISANVLLNKVLNGKDLTKDMFSFEVTQVTKDGDVILGTVTNDEDGKIKFDKLETFNLSELGTYTFKVKEVIPATPVKGMIYDTRTLTINVKVTRDGDTLVPEVSYPDGQQFINTYAPEPVYVTLEAAKELTGIKLTANMFSFNLLDAKDVAVDTKQNDAEGKITFTPQVFTKVGTYTYYIRESIPMPADKHITYDLKTVKVTITVTDNDGVLVADVVYDPDATFHNVYSYFPTDSTITFKKILTGMQLTSGMFKFELKDQATGDTVTQTNQADGTVSFKLTYSEPGTHKYIIKEIIPSTPMKYMTYDTHTVEITVNVVDDGTGVLTPEVIYPTNTNFYNSYQVRGGVW